MSGLVRGQKATCEDKLKVVNLSARRPSSLPAGHSSSAGSAQPRGDVVSAVGIGARTAARGGRVCALPHTRTRGEAAAVSREAVARVLSGCRSPTRRQATSVAGQHPPLTPLSPSALSAGGRWLSHCALDSRAPRGTRPYTVRRANTHHSVTERNPACVTGTCPGSPNLGQHRSVL